MYKYWRSLPKRALIHSLTHTCSHVYWTSAETTKKKIMSRIWNLPIGAAGLWPKTDHWQTDKTRTVTTMCWVFMFLIFCFWLLLLPLLMLICCCSYFLSVYSFCCCWLWRTVFLFRQYFCAVSFQKKETRKKWHKEIENDDIKIRKSKFFFNKKRRNNVKIKWNKLLSFNLSINLTKLTVGIRVSHLHTFCTQ